MNTSYNCTGGARRGGRGLKAAGDSSLLSLCKDRSGRTPRHLGELDSEKYYSLVRSLHMGKGGRDEAPQIWKSWTGPDTPGLVRIPYRNSKQWLLNKTLLIHYTRAFPESWKHESHLISFSWNNSPKVRLNNNIQSMDTVKIIPLPILHLRIHWRSHLDLCRWPLTLILPRDSIPGSSSLPDRSWT